MAAVQLALLFAEHVFFVPFVLSLFFVPSW
jgi:hypothetical protein